MKSENATLLKLLFGLEMLFDYWNPNTTIGKLIEIIFKPPLTIIYLCIVTPIAILLEIGQLAYYKWKR